MKRPQITQISQIIMIDFVVNDGLRRLLRTDNRGFSHYNLRKSVQSAKSVV